MGRDQDSRPATALALCLLAGAVLLATPLLAADPALDRALQDASLDKAQALALTQILAELTGLALSPVVGLLLMGIAAHVTPGPSLPFYAAWWFLVPIGVLLAAAMANDTLGEAVPLLKKPLEAVQVLFIKKGAGLLGLVLAGGHGATAFARPASTAGGALLDLLVPSALAAGAGGDVAVGALGAGAGAVIACAVYAVVWLAGHAVDVLALVIPFPGVGAALRGSRLLVILLIFFLAAVAPPLALALTIPIILVSWVIAGWSFRLTVFGAVFGWDLLFRRGAGDVADARGVLGFSGGATDLPVRTLGWLRPGPHGPTFVSRRLLLGAPRSVAVPSEVYLVRGVLFPTVADRDDARGADRFHLPPRYQGLEPAVVADLGLAGVGETRLRRGLRGSWEALVGVVRRGEPA